MIKYIFDNKIFKIIFVITLLTIVFLYFYLYNTNIKKKISNNDDNIIINNDLINFNKNIHNKCKNIDDCYLSVYFVNYISDMIQKYGLDKTINYIKFNKNNFVTDNNEYIWIHTKNNNNIKYLYHFYNFLDGKTIYKNNIMFNTLNKISVLSDKYISGFFEYKWFDVKTNEDIFKRTYIKKLKNIKNKNIYVCSGSTIHTRIPNVDILSILLSFVNIFIFIIIWFVFNIEKNINNLISSNIIFFSIIIIFIINIIYNDYTYNYTSDNMEQDYINITNISVGLSSLGIGMGLFFSRILNKYKKNVVKNSIKFLSISIIFSILSYININSDKNPLNINRKIVFKNGLLINSVIFLIITLIYIYFNNF